jgi:hypothetical protein
MVIPAGLMPRLPPGGGNPLAAAVIGPGQLKHVPVPHQTRRALGPRHGASKPEDVKQLARASLENSWR